MFRRLGRRLVCENSKFRIFFDRVDDGRGHVVDDYMVIEPKTRTGQTVSGVAVLPVLAPEAGVVRLGLLSVYRHPIEAVSLEIPRGFVDAGETEEVSALRELEEETGLTCPANRLRKIACIAPEGGMFAALGSVYVAEDCRPSAVPRQGEFGHGELHFYTVEQVRALIERWEIQDTYTLVACVRFVSGGT